jgi:hypothetical protein
VSGRDAGDAVTSLRSARETDGGASPATLRAGGDCGAISSLLVVNDVTTSPPPRASISPRKPHQRKAMYFGRTTLGQNRISARYDDFQTIDRNNSFAETNTEHGRAWTVAWFFEPRPSVRLGAEFAFLSARRIAAAESGFDPNTDGRTLTLEARYRF